MRSTYTLIWLILYVLALPTSSHAESKTETTNTLESTFDTAGHKKSKGLSMVIKYPNNWQAKEGDRPNVVQKFVSKNGKGTEAVVIVTKKLDFPEGVKLSNEELGEIFSTKGIPELLPKNISILSVVPTEIESLPAGIADYQMIVKRAGMSINMNNLVLLFIHDSVLVQVQYSVASLSKSQIDKRHYATFISIVNSIVLADLWS